jgi:hypothetical protein
LRPFAEFAENLFREIDRNRADGSRATRNGGGGPDVLGGGERLLENTIEDHPRCAGDLSDGVRVFHLAKDLGLAEHHGIEPAGDFEQVLDARVVMVLIKMGIHAIRQAVMVVEKFPYGAGGFTDVFRESVHFHPVARREDHRLMQGAGGKQPGVRVTEARLGKRQLLAHFHGRASMIQADDNQVHG